MQAIEDGSDDEILSHRLGSEHPHQTACRIHHRKGRTPALVHDPSGLGAADRNRDRGDPQAHDVTDGNAVVPAPEGSDHPLAGEHSANAVRRVHHRELVPRGADEKVHGSLERRLFREHLEAGDHRLGDGHVARKVPGTWAAAASCAALR